VGKEDDKWVFIYRVFRHTGRKKMGLRKRKMVTFLSLWNSFLFMWWLVA